MTFVDHVGEVTATSSAAALAAAVAAFGGEPVVAWWLVPARAVTRSDPGDTDSWFAPAEDKTYKQQSAYGRKAPPGRSDGRR